MKHIFFASLASVVVGSMALAEIPEAQLAVIRTSSEIETSCRVKAKEIAAETYRGCVTDQKNSQIEQIKKEYQAKLQALKAHYENELKKMSGAKVKSSLEDSETPSEKSPDKVDKKMEDSSAVNEALKSPAKKSSKAAVSSKVSGNKVAAVVSKKANKKIEPSKSASAEMTVQLKPAPVTPPADESVMDLPEPIPVEDNVQESSI